MKEIVLKEEVIVKLSGTDINILEKQIKTKLSEIGKKLFEKTLENLEETALKLKLKRCGCRGNWRHKGKKKRVLNSLLGEVAYNRTRFRCQDCGREYYPLDELLVLEIKKKATLGLIEQSLYLATDTAYDRASRDQEKLTGVKVSGRQIQNWAKEEGKRIKASAQKEREEIFDNGCIPEKEEERNRVFVQLDGIFVKNRDKEKSRSMECKVGIIYSKKEKVSKDRFKILDKRTLEKSL
jgi:hypothetical protein